MNALPQTFADACRYFADPDQCRAYVIKRRWPSRVSCPQCGSSRVYFTAARTEWECKTRHPKRRFTLNTGTIFADSPLGFDKWSPIVWMTPNRSRVSCLDVRRVTGVTHKTAWFMLERIRFAIQADVDKEPARKG
jgi:transposase-like protein